MKFSEEIKSFFESVLNGDFLDFKKQKIKFEKKVYKHGKKLNKEQVELIKEFVEKSKTIDEKNKSNFIKSLKIIVWKLPSGGIDFIADFILENIQNKNGNQRQACINLFNDWFIIEYHLFDTNKKENNIELPDVFYRFLSKLKDLIKRYQPKNIVISDNIADDPDYLDELKSSVYKSLVLLWEEATGHNYRMEEILKKYPEFQIAVPKRNYADDSWIGKNPINPDEEMLNLWNGASMDMKIFGALSALETMMKIRFQKELDNLEFDKNFSKNLIEKLKKCPVFQEATMIPFQEMTMNYIKRGMTPDQADALVRSFLLFSSHRMIENDNNEPMSQILATVAVKKAEMMLNEPKDMKSFLIKIYETHLVIDKFQREYCERKKKEIIRKGAKTHNEEARKIFTEIKKNLSKSIEYSMEQACSIAHHCFDWFVQVEPQRILSKSPEKWAALAYFFVRKFNFENIKEGGNIFYDNNDLDNLGGWTKGGVNSGSINFYYTVAGVVQDPELLYVKDCKSD